MPDLKSELTKAMKLWDAQPEPTMTIPHGRITTNSTRRTFEFIRDNPGSTRAQVLEALDAAGVPRASSRSLVSTFVLNGNVRESSGLLYANQQEYAPLKRLPEKPLRTAKRVVEPAVSAPEAAPPEASDVRSMIAKMNVMQAREMYDELRTIFGG